DEALAVLDAAPGRLGRLVRGGEIEAQACERRVGAMEQPRQLLDRIVAAQGSYRYLRVRIVDQNGIAPRGHAGLPAGELATDSRPARRPNAVTPVTASISLVAESVPSPCSAARWTRSRRRPPAGSRPSRSARRRSRGRRSPARCPPASRSSRAACAP